MEPHEELLQSLTPEEEQLIYIRDFLYDGDWDEILKDLNARRAGKPFVFKLNSRIDEDLKRIEKLRDYEKKHSVNLGVVLLNSGKFSEFGAETAEDSPGSLRSPGTQRPEVRRQRSAERQQSRATE